MKSVKKLKRPAKPLRPTSRLPYVTEINGYLYYRRKDSRTPLPKPENSYEFMEAYQEAHATFNVAPGSVLKGHTVSDAIAAYLSHADYLQHQPSTRSDYRRTLDAFREEMGERAMTSLTEAVLDTLRDRSVKDPVGWNNLRSRMIEVTRKFRKAHPDTLAFNPWETTKRLRVAKSSANKPWPIDVLLRALRAATPEFRALLVGYLLTAQRGSDVTKFSRNQYDAKARTLRVSQKKTKEEILLHVPPNLAKVIEAMAGRHPTRLFVTPRGKSWNTDNARVTLATLLRQLKLPRYTLHGLRATGPVALKMMGVENRAIRALTGHTSDANLEVYLRGVDHYALATSSQNALDGAFGTVLDQALEGANTGKAAGVTGRKAAKLRRESANLLLNASKVASSSS